MRQAISIPGLLVLCLFAGPLMGQADKAQGLQWSVGTAISHYRNVDLLPEGGSDVTVGSLGTALVLADQGPRYEANLWASGQYLDYSGGIYKDEVVRGAVGDLVIHALPEILDWSFRANYGPFYLGPLLADTPDNRAYATTFETGPSLTLGGNRSTKVVIQGTYARSSYSAVPDSAETDGLQYWTGDLAVVRALASQAAVSIHGAVTSTSSTSSADTGSYDVYDGYLRYESLGSRTSIVVDGGVTQLSNAGVTKTAPLLALELDRQLSALVTLSLSAGSGYSDSSSSFVRLQNSAAGSDSIGTGDITGVDETQRLTALNAPLKERYAIGTLSFNGRRTTLELGGAYTRQDFDSDSNLSQEKAWAYSIVVARQLTDSFLISVSGERTNVDFQLADQKEKDTVANVALTWRLGRAFSLIGQYECGRQDSNVTEKSYSFGSATLGVYYSPNSRRLRAIGR